MIPAPTTMLTYLLRFVGAVCLLATVPLLMPRSWITATHEWLGLGSFPNQPIAEYLARSTSGLCAHYGGLLVLLSQNVRRYAAVITYQAIAVMLLSLCGLVLGATAGVPVGWVALDAICCWMFGLGTLWLQRRMRRYPGEAC